MDKTFKEYLRTNLCNMFLNGLFTKPEFIKVEIIKHLEFPEEQINMTLESDAKDENGEVVKQHYKLSIFDYDFIITYDKKVELPREIEVPKVVNKPKKWWQTTSDKMVVVEKKQSCDKPIIRWVLKSIELT